MKQTTLKETLSFLRELRGFDVDVYLQKKIVAINDFFWNERLNSAVVGLSGGVDSSVVLYLLYEAAKAENSPIKHIEASFLPIYTTGVTGQDEAETRVNDLIHSLPDEAWEIINTETFNLTRTTSVMFAELGVTDPWVCGQIASIMRTPALYGKAAELQKDGLKSIVVGTTNRDEGSYIGFFGKASDAMVDLQPIADIHKSEVYALARKLNVPKSITLISPRGDVWDRKTDEQMIGAPYWFLELLLLQKEFWSDSEQKNFVDTLSSREEKGQYIEWENAIERIHSTNMHKYKVGSPARFVDVMERTIEGGWQ